MLGSTRCPHALWLGGSRSGMQIIAHGFKSAGFGRLIGTVIVMQRRIETSTATFHLVSQSHFWEPRRIILAAVLSAAPAAGLLVGLGFSWALFAGIIVIISLTMLLIGRRIRRRVHVFLLATTYTTFATLLPGLYALLNPPQQKGSLMIGMPPWEALIIIGTLLLWGATFVFSVLACWAIWTCTRSVHRSAPIELFRCSSCSYSLLGNATGVCLECGTRVPFEFSGLRAAEFYELSERLAEMESTEGQIDLR